MKGYLDYVALEINKRSVERKEANHFAAIVIVVSDVAAQQKKNP